MISRSPNRAKQKTAEGKNWLEDWWISAAYLLWPGSVLRLSYKDPIAINSNFYITFDKTVAPIGFSNQAFQAARNVTFRVSFSGLLLWFGNFTIPSSVKKFHQNIFANVRFACFNTLASLPLQGEIVVFDPHQRIPGISSDSLLIQKPSDEAIIIHRRQLFALPLRQDGQDISSRDLETQVLWIMDEAQKSEPPFGLGVMTAGDRRYKVKSLTIREWGKIYDELSQDEMNRKNLERIHAALTVVALDDNEPFSDDNVAFHSLGILCPLQRVSSSGGDANNRWYDKLITHIIYRNGRMGANGEHSPLDAPISAKLVEYCAKRLVPLGEGYPDSAPTIPETQLSRPEKLEWNLSENVQKALHLANAEHQRRWKNLEIHFCKFTDFGSQAIKQLKTAPDAFIQMAIQLAFFRLHKTVCPTYETTHTRLFLHGRTETVRTCSVESKAFVEAMDDPDVSQGTKHQLLVEAINSHLRQIKDCMIGRGIDRHLLGLRMAAMETGRPTPKMLEDEAFRLSTYFRLSTSNMGDSPYFYGGFGCAVEDGYGICYWPRPERVVFSIACRYSCPQTSSTGMGEAITNSMFALRDLLAIKSKM